jgi:hypothetical protein
MKYLTFALITILGLSLSAQVTINSSDILFPLTPDTAFGRGGQFLGVSLPTEGTNQNWDYSNINPTITVDFSLQIPDTNASFPQAQGMTVENSTLAGLTIEDNKSYYHFDANGFYYAGYQLKQKTYDMNAITGGVEDEVTVIGHHVNYGNNVVIYQMPMNYPDSWSNAYRETIPMEFDIMGFGNPGDSVVIIQDYFQSNEIVGWGSLTMPMNLGTHDALLLKHRTIRVDSVYLNGLPAPPSFISGSGLAQGDTIVAAYYELMIRGINRSAIRFNTDADYTYIQTLDFCSTPSVFSIEEDELLDAVVYPNPTKTGQVHLSFFKPNSAKWLLKVYALTGELVLENEVTSQTGLIELDVILPESSSVYLLTLTDEKGINRLTKRVVRK